MVHRPVCAKCEVEMRPKKNGVIVVDIERETATQLWSADLWSCPKCNVGVVIEFGHNPWATRFDDKTKHDFDEKVAHLRSSDNVYMNKRS